MDFSWSKTASDIVTALTSSPTGAWIDMLKIRPDETKSNFAVWVESLKLIPIFTDWEAPELNLAIPEKIYKSILGIWN